MNRPILLIDGFNLFIRSFVVNESISSTGEMVGGVLGFLRTFRNIINQFSPKMVVVAWEQGGGSPRRKHIFPEYKANRAKAKELNELYGKKNPLADQENKTKQLLILTRALEKLPVCQLYVQDTEADDVIAWYCKTQRLGEEKLIVSNDRDFYQLLEDKNIRIFNPASKLLIDHDYVLREYGIAPRNITLARAAVGDHSDNIDGVEGVGLKTIAKRFTALSDDSKDYDVGWLVEEAANQQKATKKAPKCYADIVLNEEKIRRNWQLMYLSTNSLAASQIAKLDYRVSEFKPAIDHLGFIKVFASADIAVTTDIDAIVRDTRFLTVTP